jgi:hypothetical protein
MYARYPLSLRQVEDLLFERGIDICHETVRFWWNQFGRCSPWRSASGAFKTSRIPAGVGTCSSGLMARRTISGGLLIIEGVVLEVFATKRRDREAARSSSSEL